MVLVEQQWVKVQEKTFTKWYGREGISSINPVTDFQITGSIQKSAKGMSLSTT